MVGRRIRRHCAHAYENSSIPCLVARDRKGWANVDAGLDSSDEEMLDDVPASGSTPTSGNNSAQRTPPLPDVGIASPVELPASPTAADGSDFVVDETVSRWDEVTLAESRPSTSTAGRPSMASRFSPTTSDSPPSSHNLRVPIPTATTPTRGGTSSLSPTSLVGGGPLNADGTPMINPSAVVAASLSRDRARSGKQRKQSMSHNQQPPHSGGETDGPERLPSRILRAFIATKTQSTIVVSV